jgi:hypothetical protein
MRHILLSLSLVMLAPAVMAQTKGPSLDAASFSLPKENESVSIPDPQQFRQLETESSILSTAAAEQLIKQGKDAIDAKRFPEAVQKTQEASTMLNQLSDLHKSLSTAFSGIDAKVTANERDLAVQAAVRRDEALLQLADAHIGEGKPQLAIPLLTRVVQSEQPDRDLGKAAYQKLYALGFVKSVYPADAQVKQIENAGSFLTIESAQALLKESEKLAQAQQFPLAVSKAKEAVTTLNQITIFHQALNKAFVGIDNRISEEEKQLALTAAILRDEASYQLALIHRAENKPELAVPLLVRIVQSQQPDRPIAKQAYQQLYEVGFVKVKYPR